MSMFFPVVMMGALASAAWAMETPNAAVAAAPRADMSYVRGVSATTPGLGAYLAGAIADLSGEPDTALRGYLGALSDDPDNLELRQRTFELALMAGDVPNAIRLARTLPEVEQTTMTRLVLLADDAHEGKVDGARREIREIAKVSPELLQFRLLKAYLDYAKGTPVPELVTWLDTVPMPQTMAGRRAYHQARLWLKAGEPEKALALLANAHVAEPGSVATTLLYGETLARQGQPGKAAGIYDGFRAANPAIALLVPEGKEIINDSPEAFASTTEEDVAATLADFGLLIWAQGAIGPARQVLNLSLWLNPEDVYTRYYAGLLMEMGGDLPAAEEHYERLAKGDVPDGVRLAARIRLGEVHFKQGNEDAAWAELRDLAKEHPEVLTLQRSVAQLAFNRGEYKDAVAGYSRMMAGLPDATPKEARAELHFARGAAYERGGDLKSATADMQAALALDPVNPQIMNYLGYMWVDNGVNIPEAFELLQKAHLLAPQDGAITDSLGWAYYKRGEYETAQSYLIIATEQDPESPEIFDHLGDAYAKLGRMDDARREWRRALDLVAAGKEAPSDNFERTVKKKLK